MSKNDNYGDLLKDAEAHQKQGDACGTCGGEWPCTTKRLADALLLDVQLKETGRSMADMLIEAITLVFDYRDKLEKVEKTSLVMATELVEATAFVKEAQRLAKENDDATAATLRKLFRAADAGARERMKAYQESGVL